MKNNLVYSICGMCTVRCSIAVEVNGNGNVEHIWGNPHGGGYNLCPRGAAGKVFEYDDTERPQYPLLRQGNRGEGKWKRISWDEALDYAADKLKSAIKNYGPESIVLSDRGGPITDLQKTFLAAIGSPNYFNHHATCSNSVHNANVSVTGYARNQMGYDYKNCKYLVLFGRNIFEAIGTSEAKNVIDMMESGGQLVLIDVRENITAKKADEFYLIRPGTDYGLALAIIHTILKDNLYDKDFTDRWVSGIDELREFVAPYTPQWAESETGIPQNSIVQIAKKASELSPAVIFHPGWMTAWGADDFYLRRAIYVINALLGTFEAKGGIYINKTPKDVGVNLKLLLPQVPKAKKERFDGIGTTYKHLGAQWGLAQMLPKAIETEKPYPIKAYVVMRHDPLASLPDPQAFKNALDKLDFIVSIDVNYSETAWFSDLILPESTYLERTDHIIGKNGLKPKLTLRNKAVDPRYDTKSRTYIFRELALRLGIEKYFPYNTIEELLNWQLSDTKYTVDDFKDTGFIDLVDDSIWLDRQSELKFKTPSGKIEIFSTMLKDAGVSSFKPYDSPKKPLAGQFKLITGKTAVHTQGRTSFNNPLLNTIVSKNSLVMNKNEANSMGIQDGDIVEISSTTGNNGKVFKIEVKLTEQIHPEAVFMYHGFYDTVPVRLRSTASVATEASDVELQSGSLTYTVGGNCPVTDCTVRVKKA